MMFQLQLQRRNLVCSLCNNLKQKAKERGIIFALIAKEVKENSVGRFAFAPEVQCILYDF